MTTAYYSYMAPTATQAQYEAVYTVDYLSSNTTWYLMHPQEAPKKLESFTDRLNRKYKI